MISNLFAIRMTIFAIIMSGFAIPLEGFANLLYLQSGQNIYIYFESLMDRTWRIWSNCLPNKREEKLINFFKNFN